MESSNIQPKVNHFTWEIPSWFHWFPRFKRLKHSQSFHLEIPSNQTLHNENPSNQPWSGKFSIENRATKELIICHNIRNRWRPLVHIYPKFLRCVQTFLGWSWRKDGGPTKMIQLIFPEIFTPNKPRLLGCHDKIWWTQRWRNERQTKWMIQLDTKPERKAESGSQWISSD